MSEHNGDLLRIRQNYPLELKIDLSLKRIKDFYRHFNGDCYVSFSGGKDSTVLLSLVKSLYPSIPIVFVNTGLEYPEIIQFIKTHKNVTWLKPKYTYKEIISKYGYPIISKEQAAFIDECRNTKSEKLKAIRMGKEHGISERWKFLIDAPFKISDKCCDFLKKQPIIKFEKENNLRPYIGNMAADSRKRKQEYIKYGCNSFETKRPISRPLNFWTEKDIWDYIKQNNILYSEIYNKGYSRTGCCFCAFGVHMDSPNKFEVMKETHPSLYKHCMEALGMKEVLDFCKISY